jgi:uncharacterized membrane protein YoaK (UPF0700 family)
MIVSGRPHAQSWRPTAARDMMLTLLAMAAGCLDAVTFLGLGQILVAAMTGTTVLLGIALGQGDAQTALRATVSLAGFMTGALVGAALVQRGAQNDIWSPAVTRALALEFVILVALAVAWHLLENRGNWTVDYRYPLIIAAGMAMGIQSAAAYRIGVPGVATTYVTGTLTSLAARLVGWLRASRAAAPGDQARKAGRPWLPASVCIAYGAGATFAGATHLLWPSIDLPPLAHDMTWSSAALLLPIGIVGTVILIAALVYRRRAAPT